MENNSYKIQNSSPFTNCEYIEKGHKNVPLKKEANTQSMGPEYSPFLDNVKRKVSEIIKTTKTQQLCCNGTCINIPVGHCDTDSDICITIRMDDLLSNYCSGFLNVEKNHDGKLDITKAILLGGDLQYILGNMNYTLPIDLGNEKHMSEFFCLMFRLMISSKTKIPYNSPLLHDGPSPFFSLKFTYDHETYTLRNLIQTVQMGYEKIIQESPCKISNMKTEIFRRYVDSLDGKDVASAETMEIGHYTFAAAVTRALGIPVALIKKCDGNGHVDGFHYSLLYFNKNINKWMSGNPARFMDEWDRKELPRDTAISKNLLFHNMSYKDFVKLVASLNALHVLTLVYPDSNSSHCMFSMLYKETIEIPVFM
jgi:hypothetical protein